ncbi:hypothetical protein ACFQY0_09535 [Haloferula chungangensis]|uniref:Uncharacterized protein n=1 Tax=Haloferula chungangensis TaxID=1048331 RepID=A0ABW2L787_9BACT
MKKFLTLIVAAAAACIAVPNAEARPKHAGHTYVSGRSACGCVVYSQRFISYYDHCGHPVYSVRALPVNHRCRPTVHHPKYRTKHVHPKPGYYRNERGISISFGSHHSSHGSHHSKNGHRR